MNLPTVWWLITGALIAVELMTGTFYLLMLSIGAAAAAIAAHADLTLTWQIVAGASVGACAVIAWHLQNDRRKVHTEASRNQDIHLDLGEMVQVTEWDSDGLTLVKHRGAQWTALLAPGQLQTLGAHRIVEVVGSRLVIEKI